VRESYLLHEILAKHKQNSNLIRETRTRGGREGREGKRTWHSRAPSKEGERREKEERS